MFKITAILCILAVNGENLCMFGDLPTTQYYQTPQECFNVAREIGEEVNEEFIRRNISISMQCVKIGEAV